MISGWTLRTMLAGAAVLLALDGLRRETGPLALIELGAAGLIAAFLAFSGQMEENLDDDEVAVAQPIPVWRPPAIPGASRSLLQVMAPDALDDLDEILPVASVPGRLRLLANNLRHLRTRDHRGRSVLLDNATPTEAAAVAMTIARAVNVLVIRVRADQLVSADAGFSQRALNVILHFAGRHRPAVLLVQHLDRIAQEECAFPVAQARRATHDLTSAVVRAAAIPGLLVIVATESADRLDRSVIADRFDFVIKRDAARRMPPRMRCRKGTDAA